MTVAITERPPNVVAVPEPLVITELLNNQINKNKFELAVRIAAFLRRPIDYIDDAYCHVKSLEAAQVKAMAEHPAFRGPINRVIAESLGFAKVNIDAEMISRLGSSTSSRLAVVIMGAPMAEIRQVAWMLAAVVFSKRIRALVLKTDRERGREALGEVAFDIATHEAPVLHAALCELDANPGTEVLFADGKDTASRQGQIIEFGLQIIGRFLDASEPVLGDLFSRRVPPTANYAKRNQFVRAFDRVHRDQFLKLIQRRQQSWSVFID